MVQGGLAGGLEFKKNISAPLLKVSIIDGKLRREKLDLHLFSLLKNGEDFALKENGWNIPGQVFADDISGMISKWKGPGIAAIIYFENAFPAFPV